MAQQRGNSGGGRARGGYLIEFIPIGQAVKVCAIDPETGTEVSIVGPVNAGRELLSRNAVRKLQYVLNKKKPAEPTDNRPGRRV